MFSKKSKLTKIYFATDIHGSEKCWRKLVNAGFVYEVDHIILGGDLTGKGTLVIVEEKKNHWVTNFLGDEMIAEDEDGLATMKSRAHNTGFYPYVMKPDEFTMYTSSAEYRDQVFKNIVGETIKTWLDFAERKLAGTGKKIIITAGNDDPLFLDQYFQNSDVIIWAERKLVWLDDKHQMLNEGYSNPTPWNTHREIGEDELYTVLKTQAELIEDIKNAVFNIHVPPYGSKLDDAPLLDSNLRPVDGGQTLVSVGSTAVKRIIEEYQPLLGLHGHIHESKGSNYIGKTLCLNPGSAYGEGVLMGYIINLDDNKVRSYQPVQG